MSQVPEQRTDGRRPQQLRPFSVTWNPMGFALSSLVVHTGRTAVLCSVCLEDKVPRWRKGEGLGWLSAEYRLLPGSTPQRQSRELMKLSGRTPVSYTHLRAHETRHDLVCRLLLEKKK